MICTINETRLQYLQIINVFRLAYCNRKTR